MRRKKKSKKKIFLLRRKTNHALFIPLPVPGFNRYQITGATINAVIPAKNSNVNNHSTEAQKGYGQPTADQNANNNNLY